MSEMEHCPFCGCSMYLFDSEYPDGTPYKFPTGFHYKECILNAVTWHLWEDEGWTEEKIIEAWNMREGIGTE